ncbi:MAG: LacI family DNA-binding transcriptional regulator [Trebonia sp.]
MGRTRSGGPAGGAGTGGAPGAGSGRPSMADVARLAGVSSQTVSRVSNGHSNVDQRTRERVVQAMRALGYRPNGAARALRSGRFHTIGVIMTTLRTFGNMRTLDAVAREAARSDYSVMLMPISDPTLRRVSGAYERLSAQAVDGAVIILEARLLDQAEFALPPGIPVVVVDSGAGPGYTVVDTDQALGARQATSHLLDLGHRQVWHVAGPASSYSAASRASSWRQTLAGHDITPPPVLDGDWTSESGYRAGLSLARRPEVTAVFAANDQMALGVMRALHEAGRSVPGDVSVVGFDDMEEARSFWPPLTTVRQDFTAVGRLSFQKLLGKVNATAGSGGTTPGDKTMVPTELVVRRSTDRPG